MEQFIQIFIEMAKPVAVAYFIGWATWSLFLVSIKRGVWS